MNLKTIILVLYIIAGVYVVISTPKGIHYAIEIKVETKEDTTVVFTHLTYSRTSLTYEVNKWNSTDSFPYYIGGENQYWWADAPAFYDTVKYGKILKIKETLK